MLDLAVAPALHHPNRTRIIALDVAKNETGFCVVEVPTFTQLDNDNLTWVTWGRFMPDKRNDKYMFRVAFDLARMVTEEIQRHKLVANVHVIIEHPIFGGTRSEQQYCLFQAVLAACEAEKVNVTTVTVNYLKAFIKNQCADPNAFIKGCDLGTRFKPKIHRRTNSAVLEKRHIKQMYAQVTHPANPTFPHPDNIANDDEYDAIYLALVGAAMCSEIPHYNLDTILDHVKAIIAAGHALLPQLQATPWYVNSLFHTKSAFPLQFRDYSNVVWPYQAGRTYLKAAARKNGHHSFGCTLDYLFNQALLAELVYREWSDHAPDEAAAHHKALGAKRTMRDKEAGVRLTPNYKGELFLYTPVVRKASA